MFYVLYLLSSGAITLCVDETERNLPFAVAVKYGALVSMMFIMRHVGINIIWC